MKARTSRWHSFWRVGGRPFWLFRCKGWILLKAGDKFVAWKIYSRLRAWKITFNSVSGRKISRLKAITSPDLSIAQWDTVVDLLELEHFSRFNHFIELQSVPVSNKNDTTKTSRNVFMIKNIITTDSSKFLKFTFEFGLSFKFWRKIILVIGVSTTIFTAKIIYFILQFGFTLKCLSKVLKIFHNKISI